MVVLVGSFGDFEGYSADEVKAMSSKEQVAMMAEWFRHQFEDPQNETPYNKELGGYVYMWGGPFDANDQIQEEFSDAVDFDTMMLAVDRVQREGTVEWAPQTGGDFYEHPEDDRVASGEIIDGDGDWPPIIAERVPVPPEPEARADVIRRLDELEAIVQPLLDTFEVAAQAAPMMGHNNPPEELELVHAVPREEWLRIKAAIDEIRQQAAVEQPDIESVERSNNRLLAAATALAGWIRKRLTAAVDAGVAIGVAYGIANPEVAKAALISAAQAVQTWITSMPLPF
ncbi:hypothetical protein [Celeribacter baekdonensis]|uniref:hypothetical protein n=1 Tax=Celeribacter baekdonensis TaxID=875171 RepID=UPI003A9255B3